MRNIYLIRHGRPEFPDGRECCIGLTDYPLSEEGFLQAEKLRLYFAEIPLTAVYCSDLTRAEQTAESIAGGALPLILDPALREIYCGTWEGLTFSEIKDKYPEQYEIRGIDPISVVPDNGEKFSDGLSRFKKAVEKILESSLGDIAIVAHSTVNRLFLSMLTQRSLRELFSLPQPYGCINIISENSGELCVQDIALMPEKAPDEDMIEILWKRYKTPEKVVRHCKAVAKKALAITGELENSGYRLDGELIRASALLHDIVRAEPDHTEKGARALTKEGYPSVAAIIAEHHFLNWRAGDPVSEKMVVYLADKLILGEKEVSLDERFAESLLKCATDEEKAYHQKKYEQAREALDHINTLIAGENKKRKAI